HGLALDKVITKRLIRDCGVPTPNFRVLRRETDSTGDLRYPMVVKPRHEYNSFGLHLVREPAQLRQAVEVIVTQYAQDALVEEYIEGREIWAPLLGNGVPEVLPLVEQDFGDRGTRLMTWEAKFLSGGPHMICPAQIGSKLETMLRDMSVATFRACECRDFARVDFRIDCSGQPFVLEINSMPRIEIGSSSVVAATTAGHSFPSLVNRILDVAYARYFSDRHPSGSRS
ncbi:D-alanine--D-alanine ligase family protein, partial [Ensifer aridi]|uniref:D-alanine--D-alanine ligase family protein n=1 Tax=Ensifer aridi TaxID=1708715 RepID=UPI00111C2928